MIHDVVIRSLPSSEQADSLGQVVYQYADHLLHRVGLVEFIELPPGGSVDPRVRPEADELWALLAGDCTYVWQDRREGSPTSGAQQQHSTVDPTMVLVPYGCAFGLRSETGARLIRMATYAEGEGAGVIRIPWDEM